MKRAFISGIGFELGKKLITNEDMEKLVETSDEWIQKRIGIKQRYYVDENDSLSDLAIEAAKKALVDAQIKAEDVDLIIVGSSTHDYKIGPFTASIIKDEIVAKNAWGFDVVAICPGPIFLMEIASKFIQTGHKNILIINGDIFSKMPCFLNNRTTAVIFGDAVSAFVVSATEQDKGLIASHVDIDRNGAKAICFPYGGSKNFITKDCFDKEDFSINMDGRAVYDFAVKSFVESVQKVCKDKNMDVQDVDFIISHQANKNIIVESMNKLNLPLSKTLINIEKYGNTSGASVGIALKEALDKELIKKGDIVALVAFGSGFGWGCSLLKW